MKPLSWERNFYKRRLASRLRLFRQISQKTAEEIADQLEVDRSLIFKYEKGVYSIPADFLPLFAEVYNVSVHLFFTDKDKPTLIIPKFLHLKYDKE